MLERRFARFVCLGFVAVVVASQWGCVRRRLTIHSNPPGAKVYVDNYEVGFTPCATEFIYYGTREIRLVKAGYETLTVQQPIAPPWYQLPVIDFFSENLVPFELRDKPTFAYNLTPQVIVPTPQLLTRAENLRQGTRLQTQQFAPQPVPTPLPQMTPVPQVPGVQTLPPGGQPLPYELPPPGPVR